MSQQPTSSEFGESHFCHIFVTFFRMMFALTRQLQRESYQGGHDGISALADGLRSNGSLQHLYLVRYLMRLTFSFSFGPLLCMTSGMQSFCNVGNQGACSLADALRSNSCLKTLDLVSRFCFCAFATTCRYVARLDASVEGFRWCGRQGCIRIGRWADIK
jgi:hypothetical protein